MSIRTTYLYFISAAILFVFACKKEVEILPKDATTTRYYPNIKGNFIIYRVDSLFYNQFTSSIDTFTYELKEKVTELFTDAGGRQAQRIERYKKQNQIWVLVKVWKAYVSEKYVEKSEENITYLKLLFPLFKDKTWNGNAMNALDTTSAKLQYKCLIIHSAFNNNKLNFDSCATILHESDSTLISINQTKEVYAINVGMIYKRITNLRDNTSQVDPTRPISKRANSGTDVFIYAIDFGNE